MKNVTVPAKDMLRTIGSKATPSRIRVIEVLAKELRPITVEQLQKKVGKSVNGVTLYRILDALTDAGLVYKTDLRHGHAHYELVAGKPHHHHVVCTNCDLIEDVEIPHSLKPEAEAKKRTKKFSSVESYSLEFYGLCKTCG